MTPALVREHRGHHATTDVGRRELGGYDGREGVVTTNSDAHNESPDDEDTDDVDRMARARKGLAEGSDDDEHELDTV